MNPIHFKESNKSLLKPDSMTDEECGTLPIFTDGKQCISKWKLTIFERIKLMFSGHIWLWIYGNDNQPPVNLDLKYPFKKEYRK